MGYPAIAGLDRIRRQWQPNLRCVMAQLHISSNALELCEHDRNGDYLRAGTVGYFKIAVPTEIETPEGRVGVTTTVKVGGKDAASSKEAIACARGWLLHQMPVLLSEGRYFDCFGVNQFDTGADGAKWRLDNDYQYLPDIEVALAEQGLGRIREALSHLVGVRHRFDAAKAKINDWASNNTAFGFKCSLAEALILLSEIESVLASSGQLYGSRPAHARTARRDFAELARRQVEDNTNYRSALRSLHGFAMLLSFPTHWDRRPTRY